jgi:hypothetical protein
MSSPFTSPQLAPVIHGTWLSSKCRTYVPFLGKNKIMQQARVSQWCLPMTFSFSSRGESLMMLTIPSLSLFFVSICFLFVCHLPRCGNKSLVGPAGLHLVTMAASQWTLPVWLWALHHKQKVLGMDLSVSILPTQYCLSFSTILCPLLLQHGGAWWQGDMGLTPRAPHSLETLVSKPV